jgi:hypothetical protein
MYFENQIIEKEKSAAILINRLEIVQKLQDEKQNLEEIL